MSPTGDLLVTSIFLWGGAHSSLLSGPRVLRWHSTSLVAAHPSRVTIPRHCLLNKGSDDTVHQVRPCFCLTAQDHAKRNYFLAADHHVAPSDISTLSPSCTLRSLGPTTACTKTSLYINLQLCVEEDGSCKHPCGRGNSTISDA